MIYLPFIKTAQKSFPQFTKYYILTFRPKQIQSQVLAATTTSGRADNVGAGTWVRVLLPESEPCYRSLESGSGEPGPGPEERVEMSPGSHLTWRHHSPSRSWVASVKTEWDWRSVFHQYIMIRLHWAIKNETILCSSPFFLTKCILG